jgi:hypothetical protein
MPDLATSQYETLIPTPTKREKRPNGFASLKRRNPQTYKRLTNLIKTCIDHYDWGYLYDNGKNGNRSKPRANDKDTLNFRLDPTISCKHILGIGRKQIRSLSLRNLEDHCQNQATIYYTSHPRNHYALLLFDIDDKDGTAGDSNEVLDFLQILFPKMYRQTSTFGKGSHGYIVVHYPDMTVKDFRALCKRLEAVLSQSVADHGFRSVFELKAVPGQLTAKGTYETCGTLAKFPRLEDDAAIEAFIAACTKYSPADLLRVCDAWQSVAVGYDSGIPSSASYGVATPSRAEREDQTSPMASDAPVVVPSDIDMHTPMPVCISMSEENEQQQQPSQRERLDRQQPDSPHLHSHEKPIHHIRTSKTGGCDPLGTSGSHGVHSQNRFTLQCA